jgi:hypothetical protein
VWQEISVDEEYPMGPVVLEGDLYLHVGPTEGVADVCDIVREAFGYQEAAVIAWHSHELEGVAVHVGGRRGREISVWVSYDHGCRVAVRRGFASPEVRELVEIAA